MSITLDGAVSLEPTHVLTTTVVVVAAAPPAPAPFSTPHNAISGGDCLERASSTRGAPAPVSGRSSSLCCNATCSVPSVNATFPSASASTRAGPSTSSAALKRPGRTPASPPEAAPSASRSKKL